MVGLFVECLSSTTIWKLCWIAGLDFWNQSINLFDKNRFFLAAAHVYMVYGVIFSYSEQAKWG